jgi:pimeloyl-ACP methyl ester carboxylesterase
MAIYDEEVCAVIPSCSLGETVSGLMGWRSFALSWLACVLFATGAARAQAAGDNSRAVPADTLTSCPAPGAQLRDEMQYSRVFGESRHYRIFLPANYDAVSTPYPVIYYFHGSSDRYTLEDYDHGRDTVPKICRFVASHAVIVVAVDGYIASHYTGFYGGTPYDIRRGGGDVDFGSYFLEVVSYIDSNYRTLASRRYRAVSGLSMGGFISLYLSARYPDVIGSCSAFNPGPEFYVGGKGRLSLWRPKDFVLSFEHTPVRLVRASGDYISQYTEETHAAFAAAPSVKFEFRQDEYPRHWATSIGETFEFHMRAFADASLDDVPRQWNYASAYNSFDVWGYHVQADIPGPAVIYMEQVSRGGMLLRTRRWAPDGPAAACTRIDVTTAPLYERGAKYTLVDWSLDGDVSTHRELLADGDGRLHLQSDCGGHALRIAGPAVGVQPLVLLPATAKDFLRVMPGVPVSIPLRIWNPSETVRKNLRLKLTSLYPTVDVLNGTVRIAELGAGKTVDLTPRLSAQFTAGAGDFARARLVLDVTADDAPKMQTYMDVLIAPANLRPAEALAVLDGRTQTFPIFWQGVHGGGASVARTMTEGKGNGNGLLEPGEQATVWVKLPQGLDPFDKGNWCRAKVYSDSRWLTEIADIQEDKRREWTGAQNRTSLMALNPATPRGTDVTAILDCEAYSFAASPDVRFGEENLYQPFQLHKHYLFLWSWKVGVGMNPSAK